MTLYEVSLNINSSNLDLYAISNEVLKKAKRVYRRSFEYDKHIGQNALVIYTFECKEQYEENIVEFLTLELLTLGLNRRSFILNVQNA
jgi:hypothetical protein